MGDERKERGSDGPQLSGFESKGSFIKLDNMERDQFWGKD